MLIQECWTLSSMTKHQLKELQSAPSSTENSGSMNHAELQEKLVHQNTNTFANCKYLKSGNCDQYSIYIYFGDKYLIYHLIFIYFKHDVQSTNQCWTKKWSIRWPNWRILIIFWSLIQVNISYIFQFNPLVTNMNVMTHYLWHTFMGFHLVQFALYINLYPE